MGTSEEGHLIWPNKVIPLRPPYFALARGNFGGRLDWVHLNDSTAYWFSSKQAAEEFIHRTPGLPPGTRPRHLHDWQTVIMALEQLSKIGLEYLLLNSINSSERRMLVEAVARQLRTVQPSGGVTVEVWDTLINSFDIFADEGGVAPVNDGDDVLVVSGFAVPSGIVSGLPALGRNLEATVKNLQHFHAVLGTCMVKPTPGYGAGLAKKVEDSQFVSTVNGEFGRPNVWFDDGNQIRPNNLVWAAAMNFLMAGILPALTVRRNIVIEHLRIFLNSISHTPQMRKYFRDLAAYFVPQNAVDVCISSADDPNLRPDWRSAAVRSADKIRIKSVTIQFDDEKPFDGDPGFMGLADSYAHHAFRELRNVDPRPGLFAALRQVGRDGNLVEDVTEHVLYHNPKDWERWEREMGTKLPT